MRIITGIYLLYLILPIILLGIGSFGETWTNTLLPSGLSGRWYFEVYNDASFRRAFLASLEVVAATCVLNVILGLPLAYAVYSSHSRGVRAASRIISLLPITVPELVLAFGFILVFSSDTLPWLGSLWLLIAAHVVLTLPYFFLTLISDMQHLDLRGAEAAAESLGASFKDRFVDIVVPYLRHSLLSALILVTAISIGEFQLSNLVSGFLTRTYPVLLLQAFYGATGFACAATVVLLLLAMLASLGGVLINRMAHIGSKSTHKSTNQKTGKNTHGQFA